MGILIIKWSRQQQVITYSIGILILCCPSPIEFLMPTIVLIESSTKLCPQVVGPNSSFPIDVLFKPVEEAAVGYNIVCKVKRKAQPLALKVKGEGYKIHAQLMQKTDDVRGILIPSRNTNYL
jgi:hypothetical protein